MVYVKKGRRIAKKLISIRPEVKEKKVRDRSKYVLNMEVLIKKKDIIVGFFEGDLE